MRSSLLFVVACTVLSASVRAQGPESELRSLVELHGVDRAALARRHDCATSPDRLERMAEFHAWISSILGYRRLLPH